MSSPLSFYALLLILLKLGTHHRFVKDVGFFCLQYLKNYLQRLESLKELFYFFTATRNLSFQSIEDHNLGHPVKQGINRHLKFYTGLAFASNDQIM